MLYFDYNATTPLLPRAKAAWLEATEQHWLNPSSPYRAAAAAHVRLEEARKRLAAMFDVDPRRVVFNSGATEGNNAVFAGFARTLGANARVAVGATEHPSGIEAARFYFQGRIDWLKPDVCGVIELDPSRLEKNAAVSLMAANNETGVLHPWQDWAAACRERGLPMHCDASQWIGKMPLEGLAACDYVTGCAHKFGGPKGVGFLFVPEGFAAGLLGGAQERGQRAGTEDLAGILAMLAALEWSESQRLNCSSRGKEHFLKGLQAALPGVEVLGAGAATLWNTAQIVMPEFQSTRWIRALEKEGFLLSAGSACATGKGGPSHVLAAMGVDGQKAGRTLRISAGWETSAEDWQALLEALVKCHRSLKQEAVDDDSQVISI